MGLTRLSGLALIGISLTIVCATATTKWTFRQHGSVPLNDLKLTPGIIRTTKLHAPDKSGICDPTSTSVYRKTTPSMKRAVCVEYGLAPRCWGPGKAEIDHLISLQLGGADDVKNLWPQPYAPKPGALEKDVLEGWYHRQVCAVPPKMTVEDVQRQIAQDWYKGYLDMSRVAR